MSLFSERQWVLFAVKHCRAAEHGVYVAVPRLGDRFADARVFSVVDGPRYALTVDFQNEESRRAALVEATATTEEVGLRCPWAARFGYEGPGEGVVWLPLGDELGRAELFFKTKSAKHRSVRTKNPQPQLAPEVLRSVDEFLRFALTDSRLQQGLQALREAGHPVDRRSLPHYLKWLGQDVKRECAPELADNELEWKDVSKAVTATGRRFFLDAVERGAT